MNMHEDDPRMRNGKMLEYIVVHPKEVRCILKELEGGGVS
jgi:hypothetical protein